MGARVQPAKHMKFKWGLLGANPGSIDRGTRRFWAYLSFAGTLLTLSCSGGSHTSVDGAGGASSPTTYHVEIYGHGSLTLGVASVACIAEHCTEDVTVANVAGVELDPSAPDWITEGLQVDGQNTGEPDLPVRGFAAIDPNAHTVVATFGLLPACAQLPDTSSAPVVDYVDQGGSLTGASSFAEVCSSDVAELHGSDLGTVSAADGTMVSCVTIGKSLATAYVGSGEVLGVQVPSRPIGNALVVVRTTAGRAMTMIDVVTLPSPAPSALSNISGAAGTRFAIAGVNMSGVLSVTYGPTDGTWVAAIPCVSSTATRADFVVPNDPKGAYLLKLVYNACGASMQLPWTFTIL